MHSFVIDYELCVVRVGDVLGRFLSAFCGPA